VEKQQNIGYNSMRIQREPGNAERFTDPEHISISAFLSLKEIMTE
jgi:hypothetical protein